MNSEGTKERRQPITYVAIPDQRKGKPYPQRSRPWKHIAKKSEYQFTDPGYINFRKTMITACNHYGTSRQWLNWTDEYCPINVRTLEFSCMQCDTCGVLYESMHFSGDVCYIYESTEYIGSYTGWEKDSPFCLCKAGWEKEKFVTHTELMERLAERTFHLYISLDDPHDNLSCFSYYTNSTLSPSCLHTPEELKILRIICSYRYSEQS